MSRWTSGCVAALLAALASLAASNARGDAGHVVAVGAAGPFEVHVLAAPAPLRVGASEWSVFVRRSLGGAAVTGAEVAIDARPPGGFDRTRDPGSGGGAAARSAASTPVPAARLLAGRLLDGRLDARGVPLSSPGVWPLEIRVRDGDDAGSLTFEVSVEPAASPFARHWRAFALPPVALALFALQQWRVLRRAPRRRRRR